MANFYNQANLSFGGRVTNSNITEGEVVTRVSLTKTAVTTDYGADDNIAYAISIVNVDDTEKPDITLTDDLGAFTSAGGATIVPLNYIEGSILYYQNGVLQPAPTVVSGPPLVISGITIPANGNVTILYEARTNEYAALGIDDFIINTVNAVGEGVCDDLTATSEVPTRNEALLTIAKAICPDTLTCGDQVTFTFIIQNHGNLAVIATDDAIITDVFNPILNNVTASLNGTVLTLGTDYNYDEATGEFTTLAGAITVPAANFARDPVTGIITTTPGVSVLTITGTI